VGRKGRIVRFLRGAEQLLSAYDSLSDMVFKSLNEGGFQVTEHSNKKLMKISVDLKSSELTGRKILDFRSRPSYQTKRGEDFSFQCMAEFHSDDGKCFEDWDFCEMGRPIFDLGSAEIFVRIIELVKKECSKYEEPVYVENARNGIVEMFVQVFASGNHQLNRQCRLITSVYQRLQYMDELDIDSYRNLIENVGVNFRKIYNVITSL
jgi:hypothetical protein